MSNEDILVLNKGYENISAEHLLSEFLVKYKGFIAQSSSLGLEDQVLTYMICSKDKGVRIFTLDTGRLFPETYDLIQRTNQKYGINIKVYFPAAAEVEEMVNSNGINLFYDDVEKRKLCCRIRKINPLQRALSGLKVWICGLRREQSPTRNELQFVEWDEANGLIKLNPLINWTEDQVREYIKTNKIPYNPLHDKGFPSIGCQPCTRSVMPGEDIRAGRWWWENQESKECGLHK